MKKFSYTFLSLLLYSLVAFSQITLEVQTGHIENVSKIVLSPDGKFIASGSHDKTLRLWDTRTNLQLYSWSFPDAISGTEFTADGAFLVAVAHDFAAVIDIKSGKKILEFELKNGPAYDLELSPDGKKMYVNSNGASADKPSFITVYDLGTGKELNKWQAHGWRITCLALSPNGKLLFSASQDVSCKIWNTKNGEQENGFSTGDIVKDAVFTPDGKKIIVASGDRFKGKMYDVQIWSLKGEQEKSVKNVGVNPTNNINAVSISPSGNLVVFGGHEGKAIVWDIKKGTILQNIQTEGAILDLCFTADEQFFYTANGRITVNDPFIKYIAMYNIKNARKVKEIKGKCAIATDVAVNNSNKAIISYASDGVRIWDLPTARIIKSIPEDVEVQFASTAKNNAGWAYSSQKIVKVLDANNKLKCTIPLEISRGIQLSPDGSKVIVANWKDIGLFETSSGKLINSYPIKNKANDYRVSNIAVNPDFTKIALIYNYMIGENWTGHGEQADIYEISGNFICSASFPIAMDYSTFSADGNLLIGGHSDGKDNTPLLVNSKTGDKVISFPDIKSANKVLFSNDSKKIYFADSRGKIKLCDAKTGNIEKEIQAHTGKITALCLQGDQYLLSTGEDCETKMWNPVTLEEKASFIAFQDEDYACILPDNYYSVSKKAVDGIAFRFDNKSYYCRQFDIKFNRPDIVLKRIGLVEKNTEALYTKAFYKRLKRQNLSEQLLEQSIMNLPEINIAGEVPVSVSKKEFSFKIKAEDKSAQLSKIILSINNIPIYGAKGLILTEKSNTIDKKIDVILTSGINKISVAVQNEKGLLSLEQSFEIMYDAAGKKGSLYLATIGVSEFSDASMNLKYAAKDAKDIAETFKENGAKNFDNVNIMTLTNKDATKEKIIEIKSFFSKAQPEDIVILQIATHGLLDNDLNYYLATTDIDFSSPQLKGLVYEDFENLIDGIACRKKIVLIDACHSGEVDTDDKNLLADAEIKKGNVNARGFKTFKKPADQVGMANAYELMKELFADFRSSTGAVIISAAGGAEFAYESDMWKNGVFTYSLIDGIKDKKADTNKDGIIMISELSDYIFSSVKKLTNGKQNPTSRKENNEFNFRVW